jgi:stage II sporulation protein D
LEDYLKSVVPSEMPPRWPKEAIKAQAIISRTYAMYRMAMHSNKPYDVRDDVFSQVYGGKSAEDRRVSNIIQQTQGLVLVSNDSSLLPSFFHALCGGRTENAMQIWGGRPIRALEGIECNFCEEAPRFLWSAEFTPFKISSLLDKNGIRISGIESIEVDGRTSSGRARNVLIRYAGRRERVISAAGFRLMLGPNILRSTKFSIKKQGDGFIFNGQGWGHGVGLCQWGAYFMARQGYTVEQILQHYYPFSSIVPSSEALLPLKK